MYNNWTVKRKKGLTAAQAKKEARKLFIEEHGKRAYNARLSIMSRYAGGQYVLIIAGGLSTEFYF